MRRVVSAWWRYGNATRWGWRDYARHFGLVALGVLVVTMHAISIMSNA
jgi:hypothetical protein